MPIHNSLGWLGFMGWTKILLPTTRTPLTKHSKHIQFISAPLNPYLKFLNLHFHDVHDALLWYLANTIFLTCIKKGKKKNSCA